MFKYYKTLLLILAIPCIAYADEQQGTSQTRVFYTGKGKSSVVSNTSRQHTVVPDRRTSRIISTARETPSPTYAPVKRHIDVVVDARDRKRHKRRPPYRPYR